MTDVGRGRPIDEAPFLNPFEPEVQADPEPVYQRLRAETSLVRTPLGASVLRRETVHRLFGDPRLRSAVPLLAQSQLADGETIDRLGRSVIALDGPEHIRVRRVVSRAFTPRAAGRHRPMMRRRAEQLVDRFAPSGRCELMADFASHYPIEVMCDVLGVPAEDHGLFARWGDSLTYVLSLELAAHRDEVREASDALGDYVAALVADRRTSPRDDLVTDLVQATDEGDRLDDEELESLIAALLFAGYDTTRNQLGHALFTFAQHPEQWRMLGEDPSLAEAAVEEVMRLHGAVAGVPRVTSEEVEVDGWLVPAGTIVFLSCASANRDETVYEDPLRFDITATRAPHMTFGGGPHYCLGASLARAEMAVALPVLADRMRDLRVDGEVEWRADTGIVGPERLPLAFAPS
jgi:cytochrome P450